MARLKAIAGCWLHERWRAELAMLLPHAVAEALRCDWKWLHNRNERLVRGDKGAVVCEWEFSSFLTVARVFPRVGGRLLKRCMEEWIFAMKKEAMTREDDLMPRISVVLPVGGKDRISLFQAVVASFLGQTVQNFEIIAVEHSETAEFMAACGNTVSYIHIPRLNSGEFNKSRAINEGVKASRAGIVLLHDADVLVPSRYLESLLDIFAKGWEAVRPVRLLFLLDSNSTEQYLSSQVVHWPGAVSEIQANTPGLSTAVQKDTYWRIGGHDELFEGWGGEDLEFLDRLKTTKLYTGSFSIGIHLWHEPAAKKVSGDRNNDYMNRTRRIPAEKRIVDLKNRFADMAK